MVNKSNGQDTLPKFTATVRTGNRVIISWSNPFETLVQVAVQRSYDSLKRYTTVYSAPSPELPANGFSEQIPPGIKVYYRIFYVLKGGSYFFSKVKVPSASTATTSPYDNNTYVSSNNQNRDKANEIVKEAAKAPDKLIFIKVGDILYSTVTNEGYLKLRDSIMRQTKDTLFPIANDTILIKKYSLPYTFSPSKYVYIDRQGFLNIKLSDAATKHYEIIITDENHKPVMELKQLKDPLLIMDKTNFYHAGWYNFDLLEDGKQKERGKFLLLKEF